MKNLAGHTGCTFEDFKSCLRIEVDLVEDDIRLVLDEYNSSFITYEITPSIYTLKDLSKVLFNIIQPEYPGFSNVIVIEFIDVTMKTKLIVGPGTITKRSDEKLYFCSILGFTPHWDYKQCNEYIGQKIVNSSTIKKSI